MLDFSAMYWKEMKDLFSQGNTQMFFRILLLTAMSVLLPLQLFQNWLQLPILGMLFLLINPILIVFSFVADMFAGERERHTLESLLATRLPNWSIVMGKGAALITFAWGMTVISLIASLVIANVMVRGASWTFYPLDHFLAVLLLSPVISMPAIAIGILVSLRATTVRQAQQTLSYGIIGLSALVAFLGSQVTGSSFLSHLPALSDTQIILAIMAGVIILDIALTVLVLSLFRRSRLLWN